MLFRSRVYYVSLLAMAALVVAVVVYDWVALAPAQRVTFSLLCVLGIYTAWRGHRARRESLQRSDGWQVRYIDHVGFTVISLFDGFTIVAAIDLNAPLPVVIVVGVLGVVAGIRATGWAKARALQPQSADDLA